jgi:hypothetical protein
MEAEKGYLMMTRLKYEEKNYSARCLKFTSEE